MYVVLAVSAVAPSLKLNLIHARVVHGLDVDRLRFGGMIRIPISRGAIRCVWRIAFYWKFIGNSNKVSRVFFFAGETEYWEWLHFGAAVEIT